MCGITGIVVKNGTQVERPVLQAMTDSMFHRGPDEDGLYLNENVGLGMRRLSIVDVSGGTQPLFSMDRSVAMVGNGEIYNHKDLRADLTGDHEFATSTDMEVVAPLFKKYGRDFPKKMEGMFGLAVHDVNDEKVHLFRDRIGIKPVFYHISEGAVLFSSDINSIIKSGLVEKKLNDEAVKNYFNYRFGALGSNTFFEGIHLMMPGQIMTIDTRTLDVSFHQHHDHLTFTKSELASGSEAELEEELDKRLRASVAKRLMSDVPLGSLLSSGVDSTVLTAIANDLSENQVDAFSIGYAEPSYDESAGAEESAKHMGLKWHRYEVSNGEYTDLIRPAINFNEAPVSHPNSIAVHLITKLAKENGYKVLLSGEGADELFAGYGRTTDLFMLNRIREKYPDPLLKFLTGFGLKFNPREAAFLKTLMGNDKKGLLDVYFNVGDQGFAKRTDLPKFLSDLAGQIDTDNLYHSMLQCEQRSYLQELLLRQDKMSMWSSMEVRVPFVGDPNLVSFANALPVDLKLKNGINKYLLRKVAGRYLPKHICHRKKRGFGSPIGDWLRQDDQLVGLARSLSSSANMEADQRNYYEKTLNDHLSETQDNHEIIWKMMNYLMFREEYGI